MFVHTVIMVIEPHMKQGRQHKLISTIFLATSVTKKLDHNSSGRFLYYQQGGKTGTEKVREGSCDEGGAETPVFFQFFGFYYQVYGGEFHE